MIKKITIIGVGLIGGSLAKAIKKNNLAEVVFGFGRNLSRLESAQKSNIIDQYSIDISEALDSASIVVIATPVGTFESILRELKPYITEGMIITDVGSTKMGIAKAAREILVEMASCFVPAHPIAGKEKSGFESSDAELFLNKKVIITPLEINTDKTINSLKKLWEDVGADVDFMSAHSHDELLGMTSHLPHMLAFSLVNYLITQNPSASIYAAGGFKDFSRIASGDAVMWRDICLNNRDQIIAHIKSYQETLSALVDAIDNQDKDKLESFFRDAKTTRDSWVG
ncbi:MAG: prephenate dehydrogenase/arogenate dehydrogenase family protein [Candidatus Thioglobus sp.]|nr:prephenate dehydrogenase/arogenate dehydrogenase family protein [Candidatus Thioglobus sp.]